MWRVTWRSPIGDRTRTFRNEEEARRYLELVLEGRIPGVTSPVTLQKRQGGRWQVLERSYSLPA